MLSNSPSPPFSQRHAAFDRREAPPAAASVKSSPYTFSIKPFVTEISHDCYENDLGGEKHASRRAAPLPVEMKISFLVPRVGELGQFHHFYGPLKRPPDTYSYKIARYHDYKCSCPKSLSFIGEHEQFFLFCNFRMPQLSTRWKAEQKSAERIEGNNLLRRIDLFGLTANE